MGFWEHSILAVRRFISCHCRIIAQRITLASTPSQLPLLALMQRQPLPSGAVEPPTSPSIRLATRCEGCVFFCWIGASARQELEFLFCTLFTPAACNWCTTAPLCPVQVPWTSGYVLHHTSSGSSSSAGAIAGGIAGAVAAVLLAAGGWVGRWAGGRDGEGLSRSVACLSKCWRHGADLCGRWHEGHSPPLSPL